MNDGHKRVLVAESIGDVDVNHSGKVNTDIDCITKELSVILTQSDSRLISESMVGVIDAGELLKLADIDEVVCLRVHKTRNVSWERGVGRCVIIT